MRLLVCLTILLLSLLPAAAFAEAPEGVTMLCLNIGKADCILLKLEGRAYLVDTGYKRTSDKMLGMLAHEGVTRLDGFVRGHINGEVDERQLAAVLRAMKNAD